jgi:general secretion pathway protein F
MISGTDPSRAGGLSLEQWIALNDEIAALVRAGIPLERGLSSVGSDLPGRLRGVSQQLARALGRGESLPSALAAVGDAVPPIYRAVVEAGSRTGRLSSALERLADYARNYNELRRGIGLALMYPLIVLGMGYVLFVGFVSQIVPRFVEAYSVLHLHIHPLIRVLDRMGERVWSWGPVVPALVGLGLGAWWLSGRAGAFPSGRVGILFGAIPWVRGILANSRAANFAELLALLVEHDVPLPEALDLASRAAGDRRLIRSAGGIAEGVRRGEPLDQLARQAGSMPPLLRWMIAASYVQGTLVTGLRHGAMTYRRRALYQAEMARTFLPTFLLLAIGATATIFFTLTIFVPFSRLIHQLSFA